MLLFPCRRAFRRNGFKLPSGGGVDILLDAGAGVMKNGWCKIWKWPNACDFVREIVEYYNI
jgi:hypothetical protein